MSGTFLSRWARRKNSVRAAERSDAPAVTDAARAENVLDGAQSPGASEDPQPADGRSEASDAVSDDLLAKLPSLDALTPDTDLSAFLQAGVPTALRNAALRRMWSLDPAIRDFVSEAREYAYDWNTPGGVPGMGPLLPTDDVKAMLKRVIDGVPVEDPKEPEAAPREPETALHEPPSDASEADLPEAAALSRFEEATSPGGDSDRQIARLPEQPSEAAPSSPIRHRLRRHGGAMPS